MPQHCWTQRRRQTFHMAPAGRPATSLSIRWPHERRHLASTSPARLAVYVAATATVVSSLFRMVPTRHTRRQRPSKFLHPPATQAWAMLTRAPLPYTALRCMHPRGIMTRHGLALRSWARQRHCQRHRRPPRRCMSVDRRGRSCSSQRRHFTSRTIRCPRRSTSCTTLTNSVHGVSRTKFCWRLERLSIH